MPPFSFFELEIKLRNDVDFFTLKAYGAGFYGKEGEIPAHSDVETGSEFCSALAHDD